MFARLPALVGMEGTRRPSHLREKSLPHHALARDREGAVPAGGGTRARQGRDGAAHDPAPHARGGTLLAPHLSVTFSQPMIAVTSHDEAGAPAG